MKTLKELNVSITSGTIITRLVADSLKGETAADFGRKTIVSKTVEEGYIDDESLLINDYKVEPDEKKLTKEGDIIIKLAAPYRATLIDKEHEGLLVSSFCSIIRDIKAIDKKYLVAYLNSDICVKQLEMRAVGTTIAMLSNGKLYNLPVPVPSADVQKSIGEYFEKTIKNRLLLKKIIEVENEKLARLIADIEE